MDIPVIKFDPEEKKVVQTEPAVKGLEPQKLDHKINRYFFLAIIIIFGLILYYSLSQFFTAFLGAVIFYVLSKKRMDKLVKRGWKKPAAATVIMLISLIIIIVPILIVGFLLYQKGRFYIANPDLLVQSLHQLQAKLQQNYNLAFLSDENIMKVKTFVTGAITNLLNESLGFFVTISMLYFFFYFMLININRMEAAIVFFLPFKREKIELFGKELVALTFSNSIGVPAIAVAQGVIGYIGYLIVGLPEAGFWAVMTGFASIVPIVGSALIWAPATIYLFTVNQTWEGIFLGLWGVLVIGVSDNVVRFVLAKKMADVHPIVTVLGVIMGLQYFGIAGLVFGPVLISYFIILLKIYYLEYQSVVPVIKKRRSVPIRFNLPFLGGPSKKKKIPNDSNRSKRP
ncbi:AI-2E family transporter [Aridibaculum aurantiacum]|uniref:AI-2E family transporter n=1 Tax=Aridibaculum aurantiacum TaxID=2810307 RepID=UPI001A974A10|nr:AI-2E family transporter [Aridibaculum aurantiacum]